ncbi:hypothetical protein F4678DRAFT_478330 [Xylaria arbuscula]|nr:hypothetical protein F4678DRAFT_478330 [Xylaria arbuscula]
MREPLIQDVLSLGLQKLNESIRAGTCEEWKQPNPNFLKRDLFYLHDGFRDANKTSNDLWLYKLDLDIDLLYIKQPVYADLDSGPAAVWRWAHYRQSWSEWVYQEDRNSFRRWGWYVMWDRSRLDAIGIFQNPWEAADEVDPEVLIVKEEEEQRKEEWWRQMEECPTM